MSESRRTTRRSFIKSAAGTGLALSALPYIALGRAQQEENAAPEKLQPQLPDIRVAFIGTGGMGEASLECVQERGGQCPCYCDVDERRIGKAKEWWPKAKFYSDYREMFDKEHKNFDAVMVATPDHHHYPATIIAMQLGKHVYTQKPLTHTVWEARELAKAAKKYKVATQMGNQGHGGEGWRTVVEWIRSGAIGPVREVHTWTDRPIWPQGMVRPDKTDEIPKELNWDAWLGPAPERPYVDRIYHPFAWRGWWDFGCGALGDMACHQMDGMFWALEPGHPTAIEPIAVTPITADAFPKASVVKWQFPAQGDRPAFDAYWYDGHLTPTTPAIMEYGRSMPSIGSMFVGDKAALIVSGAYGENARIVPEKRMREVGLPPKMLERSEGHYLEWLLAVAGEKPIDHPKSNFAYAAPMTETILLGNVALRTGRRLEWDGENMHFTNVPEADEFITKKYRDGWFYKL